MNYEQLLPELLPTEKKLKDSAASCMKLCKNLSRDSASGDLRDYRKILEQYRDSLSTELEQLEQLEKAVLGFDEATYFKSGDFARQLLEAAKESGIDVVGEAPVFEMFPYRIRIDEETQDVYIDRKKAGSFRPSYVAEAIKTGQNKLNKASFNELGFASELAQAYDLAILKTRKKPSADLYLNSLYKFLVPMSRSRKEYDQQSYAFDLARLYSSGLEYIRDGRRFQFGPSRDIGKSIRILDKEEKEQYLATIRFF